jgi:hypothetical protein
VKNAIRIFFATSINLADAGIAQLVRAADL